MLLWNLQMQTSSNHMHYKEFLPDMVKVKSYEDKDCTLVGNYLGSNPPEEAKVGIMPGFTLKKCWHYCPNQVLKYEAADQVVKQGFRNYNSHRNRW